MASRALALAGDRTPRAIKVERAMATRAIIALRILGAVVESVMVGALSRSLTILRPIVLHRFWSNQAVKSSNLRAFAPEQAEERLRDFKSFVESALMTMVFGASQHDLSSSERQLRQLIRALLVPVVNAFFDDEQIKSRYDRAIADGFGTESWSQMPTLSDFLDYFLHQGKSEIEADVASSEQIDQATNQINLFTPLSNQWGYTKNQILLSQVG